MQKWKSSLGVVLLSVGMAFVVGGCMSEQTQGQASEQAQNSGSDVIAKYEDELQKIEEEFESKAAQEEALRDAMGFYVDGNTLYDANGNPFIMRGVNHGHAWFTGELETTLSALEELGCNTVRVVLADGEQWTKTSLEELEMVIESCKAHNLVAVLEVHDATCKSETTSLIEAAQFFVDAKEVLIGQEDYVILNIANEWGGYNQFVTWRKGYCKAIPMLRDAGLAHTIMVDCPSGGQQAIAIQKEGAEIFESDSIENVMFAVHMYGTAGGSAEKIEKNLKYATDMGFCVCVGEFGHNHSDGDIDEDYVMEYCQKNSIGYLAWSWKGNASPVEYLDLSLTWDGSELSQWGKTVFEGPNGIGKTAKLCSVFE